MGDGLLFFSEFLNSMSGRALLTAFVAVPLILGMLILLLLVNEIARLRSLEYSQRLARNIWDDGETGKERFWDPGEDHGWKPEGLPSRERGNRGREARLFPH